MYIRFWITSSTLGLLSVQIPSPPMTDTGSHVTLRIYLMYRMPTFDTLFLYYNYTLDTVKREIF